MRSRLMILVVITILSLAVSAKVNAWTGPAHGGESGLWDVYVSETLSKGQYTFGLAFKNFDREFKVEGYEESLDLDISTISAFFTYAPLTNLEFSVDIPYIDIYGSQEGTSWRVNGAVFDEKVDINGLGDVTLGGKWNLLKDDRLQLGLSLLGFVKLGTADYEKGLGTGETDFGIKGLFSKRFGNLGLHLNAGYTVVGEPEEWEMENELNYGLGVDIFASENFAFMGELIGGNSRYKDYGEDYLDLAVGVKGFTKSGLVIGGAVRVNMNIDLEDCPIGGSVFLAYWPGAKAEATPAANNPPTVKLRADKTELIVGDSTNIYADARDPDGDVIYYSWSTDGSPLPDKTSTILFKGEKIGSHNILCRVDDGKGGEGSDTIIISVLPSREMVRPKISFPDYPHFEFDRADLDEQDKAAIRKVAEVMKQYPDLKIIIEGYTCPIGTDEYNLALGQRRAIATYNYLISLGIDPSRVSTISYGEDERFLIIKTGTKDELAPNRRAEFKVVEEE